MPWCAWRIECPHLSPELFVALRHAVRVLLGGLAVGRGSEGDLLPVLVGARHKHHVPAPQALQEARGRHREAFISPGIAAEYYAQVYL